MKKRFLVVCSFSVLCCLLLTGCTAKQIGREFDAVFGSLAREHVENLGSPGRGHSLVKQQFSDEYAVFSEPNWVLYLSEKFAQVRVVKQITEGKTDYAILACTRADGSLKNMLVLMTTTPADTAIYNLDSNSNKPFFTDARKKPVKLIQEMDSSTTVLVWWLDKGLRGPSVIPVTEPPKEKSSRKSKGRAPSTPAPTDSIPSMPLPPPVNPTAKVRMEEAAPTPQGTSKPGEAKPVQPKPVIILDPQPAQSGEPPKPASSEKPTQPNTKAPVIIIQ